MAKEKFERRMLYVGPVSSFSVMAETAEGEPLESDDRPLVTGVTYDDLPKDHPVINNLIAGKMLVPSTKAKPSEASPKPAMADSSNSKTGDDQTTSTDTQEGKAK